MKTQQLFEVIHNTIIGKTLLEKAQFIDQNANGVQIWGDDNVKKVALGVSCNEEFLEKASRWGAEVCLFHHGLGLNDHYIYNSRLDPSQQRQLKIIFNHNLTIAGYHFTLDSHPEIGNNVQIIKSLGGKVLDLSYFDEWGWCGEFEDDRFIQDVAKDCSKLFKHDVFMILGGPEKVKRFGVCSGGAKPSGKSLFELLEKAIDLHISGEIAERGPSLAKESGFNYFACGHYATEVFGIKALGEKLKTIFPSLEVEFIDVWNEL